MAIVSGTEPGEEAEEGDREALEAARRPFEEMRQRLLGRAGFDPGQDRLEALEVYTDSSD